MFERFEKLIFKIVRGVLLVFALFAFISLIVSGVFIATSLPKLLKDEKSVSVKVSYEEVDKEVQTAKGPSIREKVKKSGEETQVKDSKQDKLSNYIAKIMNALQEKYKEDAVYYYQKEQVEKNLRDILSQIPEHDLDSFVDGMVVLIKKAKEEEVFPYVNTYIQIYWKKHGQETNKVVTEKAKANQNILTYLGTIVSSVMILILAGIVLILTAIERNTRPHERIQ